MCDLMNEDFEHDEDTLCIYEILKKENDLSSRRVLELAASDEFKDICTGCASGDTFLRAIKRMEQAGLVSSSLGKGGYRWHLNE